MWVGNIACTPLRGPVSCGPSHVCLVLQQGNPVGVLGDVLLHHQDDAHVLGLWRRTRSEHPDIQNWEVKGQGRSRRLVTGDHPGGCMNGVAAGEAWTCPAKAGAGGWPRARDDTCSDCPGPSHKRIQENDRALDSANSGSGDRRRPSTGSHDIKRALDGRRKGSTSQRFWCNPEAHLVSGPRLVALASVKHSTKP